MEDIEALVISFFIAVWLEFNGEVLLDHSCLDFIKIQPIWRSALFTLEEQSFRNADLQFLVCFCQPCVASDHVLSYGY